MQEQNPANPAKFGLARTNPAKSSKELARSGLAGPIPGVRRPIRAIPNEGLGASETGRETEARAWNPIEAEAEPSDPIGQAEDGRPIQAGTAADRVGRGDSI
jgi:hypothetical protein